MAVLEDLTAKLNQSRQTQSGNLPKLDWQPVEIDTLPPNLAKEFKTWREAADMVQKQRETMEKAFDEYLADQDMIPEGKVVRYSYNWGNMALAFADPDQVRGAKGGKKGFSFAPVKPVAEAPKSRGRR